MGCCSSNYNAAGANTTIDGLQLRKLRKATPTKRSYSSRLSSASSGIFSRAATPTRSGCASPTSSSSTTTTALTPRPKPNNYKLSKYGPPSGMENLSICDDFCESEKLQQQLENSCGYFTETISSGSATSSSKSALRYTRDMSFERADTPTSTTSCGNLEMEMYMMTHAQCLMAKTSSPMPQRRSIINDHTYDVAGQQQQSASYNKWCNYLQSTPAYMVNNLTKLPEAIAGHFCPSNFPAFVELDYDDAANAAKRFKGDDDCALDIIVAKSHMNNAISTEL